jgi:hypothetical protein
VPISSTHLVLEHLVGTIWDYFIFLQIRFALRTPCFLLISYKLLLHMRFRFLYFPPFLIQALGVFQQSSFSSPMLEKRRSPDFLIRGTHRW